MDEILVYFALKYQGDFYQILTALKLREAVDEQAKASLLARLKASYITIVDDDYPEAFKYIACPPFVIFYYGDKSLLKTDCMAVTGTRYPNHYGYEVTRLLTGELVRHGYTIVSGLSMGIDRLAHYSAMNALGHTIGVLGCGIEDVYPPKNEDLYAIMKDHQLIISEYPGKMAPTPQTFRFRNRLVSGLGQKLLITQCPMKSKAMVCVSHALEQGKDVGAVPGRIYDPPGTNYLIDQGAKLVTCVEDLIDEPFETR